MMAFRQYFWVDVANRGLTTVVPHEHFEWQIQGGEGNRLHDGRTTNRAAKDNEFCIA